MDITFYLQHAAYEGELGSAFEQIFPKDTAASAPLSYPTRRLDDMCVYSVEATLRALAERGIDRTDYSRYGVVSVSHNGPCIYSEDFYKQLLDEEDPRMVSPMLFTESVLNIVTTHIALALKTHCPVLSLNAGLDDYFNTLFHAGLLLQSGHFERAVFCAAEEFSITGGNVFHACEAFHGTAFCGGAATLLLSREPLPGINVRMTMQMPFTEDDTTEKLAALADKGAHFISSAFSEALEAQWIDRFSMKASVAQPLMETRQGFMALRTLEVADAARIAHTQQSPVVLLDRSGGTTNAIIMEPVPTEV